MFNQRNKKRGENKMTENNNTLSNIIQTQIQNTINTQPHPTQCTITKTYTDGYTDIHTDQYGTLKHIPTIGNPEIGYTGVLIFLDNTYTNRIIITSTHIPESDQE